MINSYQFQANIRHWSHQIKCSQLKTINVITKTFVAYIRVVNVKIMYCVYINQIYKVSIKDFHSERNFGFIAVLITERKYVLK